MTEIGAERTDGPDVVQDDQQEIQNLEGEPNVVVDEHAHAAGEVDLVLTSEDDDDKQVPEPAARGRGRGKARGRGRGKQLAGGPGAGLPPQPRSSRSRVRKTKEKVTQQTVGTDLRSIDAAGADANSAGIVTGAYVRPIDGASASGGAANYNRWAPEAARTQGLPEKRRFGDDFEHNDKYNNSPEKANISYKEFIDNLLGSSEFCNKIAEQVARWRFAEQLHVMSRQDPRESDATKLKQTVTPRVSSPAAKASTADARTTEGVRRASSSRVLSPMFRAPEREKVSKKPTSKKQKKRDNRARSSSTSSSSDSSVELSDENKSKKIDSSRVSNVSTSSSRTGRRRGKVNLPTFDGTDYPVFRQLFMANADTFAWSETEKLQYLLGALRGPAKAILTLMDDQNVTYQRLLDMLEDRYGASKSYTDIVDQMKELKRKPTQSLYDFVIDVKRMLRRTQVTDEERGRLARHYFVQGLPNREQRAYVDRKDKARNDVIKALSLAQKWERRHSTMADVASTETTEVKASEVVEDTADVNRFYQSNQGKQNYGENRYAKLERENKELRELMETYKKQVDEVLKKQQEADKDHRGGYRGGGRPWRNNRGYRGNRGGAQQQYQQQQPVQEQQYQQRGNNYGYNFRRGYNQGGFRQRSQQYANQIQADDQHFELYDAQGAPVQTQMVALLEPQQQMPAMPEEQE